MSGGEKILLWLHLAAVIFLLGPLTIVTTTTPRYLRTGDIAVVRHLNRATRTYGWGSLLVLAFGAAVGHAELAKPWLTASFTLFVVGFILIMAIVERDQRKAISALEAGESADVHRGRIVAVASTVALIWLVVLVLMVWRPGT